MTTHRKLSASKINGRWTSEEHRLFIEGLAKYGKDWKKIEDHIKSRDGAQIRSHAQKFFLRMTKEYKRMLKTGKYSDKLPSFSFDSQESSRILSEKEEEKTNKSLMTEPKDCDPPEKNGLEGLERLEKVKKAFELSILSLSLQTPQELELSALKQHHSFYNYMEKGLQSKPEKRKLSDLVEFPAEIKQESRPRGGSFTLCKKSEDTSASGPYKRVFC